MATDPTRSIEATDISSPLSVDIRSVAERLAAIEPSLDVPIVTVSLDWRIEGTNPGRQPDEKEPGRLEVDTRRSSPQRPTEDLGEASSRRRPARRVFDDELDRIVDAQEPRSAVHESLKGDYDRITAYLDGEVEPSARGIYIVSCTAKGIFEAVPVGFPMATEVTVGPTPVLTELVRLEEDYPAYAMLLADQREATLSIVTHGISSRNVEFEGAEYPRHQAQGGWSQRRYQARADERIEAFARDIAKETRRELDEHGVDTLIVAGDEVITTALNGEFHQTVKDRIAGTLRLDMETSDSDLLDASLPIALRAERAREADAVRRMADGVGAGTYGAGGDSDVLTALQAGQVETLVMNDDFEATGWADFTMPAYGVGDLPATHPFGGNVSNLVPVDLRGEMVRLAVLTGAEVEIVHTALEDDGGGGDMPDAGDRVPRSKAARQLDEFGGVGAVLRYVIGDEPSEEESAAQEQDQNRS